ncbi:MAG: 2-phospho-L-lactate guanylyltransferase, partial [Frankiaceae bacterium]
MPLTGQDGWVVLIPVKELGAAKTRLHVPHRDRVALAMSVDTVDAAASASTVRAVVVVTDDPRALAAMQAPKPARPPCAGVCVLPDAPRAGLNAALRH